MATNEDFNGEVTYMVAYNDDDEFVGLLLDSESGIYGRASGSWFTVTGDNPQFSGINIMYVDEDFLEFFDKLDSKGNEPTMKQANSYIVDPEQEQETE